MDLLYYTAIGKRGEGAGKPDPLDHQKHGTKKLLKKIIS
jgi:hypothetical protein